MVKLEDFRDFDFGSVKLNGDLLNSIYGGKRATEYGSLKNGVYTKEGSDSTAIEGLVCSRTEYHDGPQAGQWTNTDYNTGCA
jgi:hypothetical protein